MSSPGPASAPRICCLDLDTFFVSVERLLDPSLEGKPVVVGGKPKSRGVVTAASYEVREFGVRSGMSLTKAYELAPHAVFVPTRHDTYGDYAERVREVARSYSPAVQVASIDEMYIDFRGCERMHALPSDPDGDTTIYDAICRMTREIFEDIGLPSSAGIATSKVVSKVASGLAKPRGVLMVPAGSERSMLGPLPVRRFPGIGPVAESKLLGAGIKTLAQLDGAPDAALRSVFGAWGPRIRRGVRGQGSAELGRERPAFREHDPDGVTVGSISNERTFREDVGDPASIESMLCSLTERVCWRARKRGVKARTVTLKLRYADFTTISRSRTFAPTHSELELYPIVHDIYTRARTRTQPIRLLGLALSNLGMFEQLELFEGGRQVHQTIDAIRERFGYDTVRLATGQARRSRNGQ